MGRLISDMETRKDNRLRKEPYLGTESRHDSDSLRTYKNEEAQ